MTSNKRPLQLDRENAKWLGVCAGIARFVDVQPWTVRVVFIGCMLFGGWFLLPGYFIAWYLMDENAGRLRDVIIDNQAVKHLRSVDYRKKLYRDPENGKIWGICAGIAEYLEVDVTLVRMLFMVLTFIAGFPLLFYVGSMFVLDRKPPQEYRYQRRRERRGEDAATAGNPQGVARAGKSQPTADEERDSRSRRYSQEREPPLRDQYSQRREFQYCARKFASLQQRLARVEAYVTSPRFKLHREFRNMS